MSTFHDERGQKSAARTFLLGAFCYQGVYLAVWGREADTLGVVLAYFTAIDLGLISWAGGARVAAYIGGQIGGAVQGVAQAAKAMAEKIRARRNPDGTESAGRVPQAFDD